MINKLPTLRFAIIFFLCFCVFGIVRAANQTPYSNTPSFSANSGSASIKAVVSNSTTTYIAGNYLYAASSTAQSIGIPISRIDGSRATVFPKVGDITINQWMYTSLPDGNGGWYIGGNFNSVGGYNIPSLAHILSNGTVDTSWVSFSGTGSTVSALAISTSTNTIFVGGTFTSIGGQTRNNLAEISLSTGLATSWNPGSNGQVTTLALSTSTIYVGSLFGSIIGGQTRNNLAEVSLSTGLATSWNPNPSGSNIYSLALSTSTIYVGGDFTTISGQNRNYIAEIYRSSGLATAWDPNSDAPVITLALSTSTIYVGSIFGSTIGGQTRNCAAEISLTTGLATTWNPNITGGACTVNTFAIGTSTIYIGGNFTKINGQFRNNLGEMPLFSNTPTAWNPWVQKTAASTSDGDGVLTLSLATSTIFVGGNFISAGGYTSVPYLSAIDNVTKQITSWNPNVNGEVDSLTLSTSSTLYLGGKFTSAGGQTRNKLAEVSLTTGLATAWNPNIVDGTIVNSLAVSSDGLTIYAGGDFTKVNGSGTANRNRIAAFNNTNGTMTSWNPSSGGTVNVLTLGSSSLFVGGQFTTIGGQTRNNLAELSLSTGNATAWNPSVTGSSAYVKVLSLSASTIYTGGYFTTIGGVSRKNLAEISLSTGSSTAWNPNIASYSNNGITGLAVGPDTVFVGGDFTLVDGGSRTVFAELNKNTGLSTSWKPKSGANYASTYNAMVYLNSSTLYIGCTFAYCAGGTGYLSIFDASTYPSISFSSPTSSYSETSGL
ncbi:MAG: hypothetical protein WCK48_00005, partial [bacterium]